MTIQCVNVLIKQITLQPFKHFIVFWRFKIKGGHDYVYNFQLYWLMTKASCQKIQSKQSKYLLVIIFLKTANHYISTYCICCTFQYVVNHIIYFGQIVNKMKLN